MNVSQL